MPKKLAVLIDGGHLRVLARKAGKTYDPALIEQVALRCHLPNDEEIYRVLYYDCAPYMGKAPLPVSGTMHQFVGSDRWLHELSKKDLFAIRRGVLKFRGWKPKHIPVSTNALTDADFEPLFEQKGVDMRIGLDIALFCQTHAVERIALVPNDTDCVAALKHARRSGLQTVLICLPNASVAPELAAHADYQRQIAW
jgi:uncharacterized LabA/DUF88 family protein